MKRALLLGSFNPPHIGHLYMAVSALNLGLIDKVTFVPAFQNPWKENYSVDFWIRCYLISLSIENIDNCDLSTIEYQCDSNYSCDVLKLLKEIYKNDELFLIIGKDTDVKSWKEGDWIINNFKIITVNRNNNKEFTDIPENIEVSSTQIRNLYKENKQVYPLVPKLVDEFIKKYNLYK